MGINKFGFRDDQRRAVEDSKRPAFSENELEIVKQLEQLCNSGNVNIYELAEKITRAKKTF